MPNLASGVALVRRVWCGGVQGLAEVNASAGWDAVAAQALARGLTPPRCSCEFRCHFSMVGGAPRPGPRGTGGTLTASDLSKSGGTFPGTDGKTIPSLCPLACGGGGDAIGNA